MDADWWNKTMNHSKAERMSHKPWNSTEAPAKILAIRFHAIGDVAITLPCSASLRRKFPGARFGFLTGTDSMGLPQASGLFDEVMTVPVSSPRHRKLQSAFQVGLKMRQERFDVILDLQRNWMSRIIRMTAAPRAWAEFDRFSSQPAGVRTQAVFHSAGFTDLEPIYSLPVSTSAQSRAKTLLLENGWDGKRPLVVLNPAGLWESRNWPLSSYCAFARLWLKHEEVQFILVGTNRIRTKAMFLQEELGTSVINLVERTSLSTALAALQYAMIVLSEDSGLLHMSWVSGIPTVALFGSSRADWPRPLGGHSLCFSSHDLDCGECMKQVCRFGDVHCLTRFSPDMIFEAARTLLRKRSVDSLS